MTILPAKRTSASSNEDNKDGSQQNNNTECTVRRRDDHSIPQIATLNESVSSNRRTQFPYGGSSSERKDRCFKKRYKESDRPRDREREREQKREARREQKRDRVAKRELTTEPILDPGTSSSSVVPVTSEPVCNPVENGLNIIQEDCTGFNSEDEYDCPSLIKNQPLTDAEWQARDELFSRCIASLGYEIKQMNEDGACLFRSIADQVYGDQELHFTVRTYCMDYIVKNKDYFAPYVTEDFDKYIARKRKWNVHGNHLEIQAMSEMYNRTIEVYCYQIEPINIFNGPNVINANEPIRLSYHRMCHYNSISNPNNPSVGVGLGLPNYHTIDLDRRRFNDAMRASEELLIEQTMLEDKLKATDWEATNEAIEEQIARESYIQYIRDVEHRLNVSREGHPLAGGSTSTSASTSKASPRTSRRGSVSPKGGQSPKAASSCSKFSIPALGTTSVANVSPSHTFTGFTSDDFEESYRKFCATTQPHSSTSKKTVTNSDSELYQPGPSKENTSPSLFEFHNDFVMGFEDEWDQEIMARVLDESRKTYLQELKKKSHKRNSAGASTSS